LFDGLGGGGESGVGFGELPAAGGSGVDFLVHVVFEFLNFDRVAFDKGDVVVLFVVEDGVWILDSVVPGFDVFGGGVVEVVEVDEAVGVELSVTVIFAVAAVVAFDHIAEDIVGVIFGDRDTVGVFAKVGEVGLGVVEGEFFKDPVFGFGFGGEEVGFPVFIAEA